MEISFVEKIVVTFWNLINLSSSWLLLGFALAAFINGFLKLELIQKYFSKPGLKSVFLSSIFGIPLPLCSCSVIPFATMLRSKGASKGAVSSFLVSTPEIGVDSFMLSYGLLGSFVSFVRLIVAFFTAMITGFFVDMFDDNKAFKEIDTQHEHSCCKAEDSREQISEKGCCDNGSSLFGGMLATFNKLFRELSSTLLFGFFISALLMLILPENFFRDFGFNGFWGLIVMLIASLPMYVCAASSTPLAAVLLAKGVSVGGVLIFLFAGPVTNIITLSIIRKLLGTRVLVIFLFSVVTSSLFFAMGVDFLIESKIFELNLNFTETHLHSHQASLFDNIMSIILIILMFQGSFRAMKTKE